jgi:DNA-directed RNA polymerase subunit beta'
VRLTEWTKDDNGEFEPSSSWWKPPSAVRCCRKSCPRACRSQHQQGAEEEGNLQADQRLLPQVRPEGNRGVRRQAAAVGFRLATRAGISIAIDDMLVPPQKPA